MSKPKKRVTFMITPNSKQVRVNSDELASGARSFGWQTEYADIDSLRLDRDTLCWAVDGKWRTERTTDLIWITSLGEQATFLDKMQLLQAVSYRVPVLNTPVAIVFWHSKYPLAELQSEALKTPETYAGADSNWLYTQMRRRGGVWMVKPPAGSRGEGIYLLDSDDLNARTRLEATGGYQILQRWIPEVRLGEKRVLLAGGEVIGQYLRTATNSPMTNLAQGACASSCSLTRVEQRAMHKLAEQLKKQGIVFASVDLCWPWLIEINILNPGGLATIKHLTGDNLSEYAFVAAVKSVHL